MLDASFLDITIDSDRVALCGVNVRKPAGVSVVHWMELWEALRDEQLGEDEIYEREILQLENERDELRKKASDMEDELDALTAERDKLAAECARLADELAEARKVVPLRKP